MKRVTKFIYGLALLGTSVVTLASCGPETNEKQEFSFSAVLQGNKDSLEFGETCQIEIHDNGVDTEGRSYKYESKTPGIAEVSDSGLVTTTGMGKANLVVTETKSNKTAKISFQVVSASQPAKGGYNFSSLAGKEGIEKRTEILGKLEKYAVDSHLTGITLFENGGLIKYSSRTQIPAKNYITGYGFGILSEGSLVGRLPGDPSDETGDFYHSAQTQDPGDINAWNASGSAISDLSGYITSSFWSTKMNAAKNGYVWYPLLAADTVGGKENSRPIPVGPENDLGLYSTWKIYVKTDANMGAKGLKFHTMNASYNAKYPNGIPVTLDDYEYAYRMILTGSNKQSRGTEMAGDKTYGIKGAQSYWTRTKNASDEAALTTWNNMKKDGSLGIKTGSDANGDYIELELIREIDSFTAMYTLSSNLLSPMKEDFIKDELGGGSTSTGLTLYGKNGDKNNNIPNNVICLGAYMLKSWTDEYITFVRSDDWFEVSETRYLIPGVRIQTFNGASQDQLYQYFDQGLTDAVGIPTKQVKNAKTDEKGTLKKTEGDSTFKLNVNSCTQDRWDELDKEMWKNTKIDDKWGGVKPWMSNENFLKGLYWSIDRENFANERGVTPSINYFSNAYLSDPEGGVSYNSTKAHQDAVAKYHAEYPAKDETGKEVMKDNYGYDYAKAVSYMKAAYNEMKGSAFKVGTPSNPTEIHIHIRWMYKTDVNEYGNEIASYFEKAFNDNSVSGGRVKLVVDQDAVTNWEDVYNVYMMKGQFDLAFGAISGNTYNPLNFLEVLKSDNSSTFTLNWGPDTSKVDENNPIVYNGEKFAFDALWEVADRGGVVENGRMQKTVKTNYFKEFTNNADGSLEFKINLDLVDVTGVEVSLDKVSLYAYGSDEFFKGITSSYDKANKLLTVNVSKETADKIIDALFEVLNKNKKEGDPGYVEKNDILIRSHYGEYFDVELYYSIRIAGGTPSQSVVVVALTEEDQPK